MLFNSWHFLLFFIAITVAYYNVGLRSRQLLLLLGSVYFYMVFKPIYILILLFTIVIDYIAGIYIYKAPIKYKKVLLIISLISNIGILAYFKYFNFFAENINLLFGTLNIEKEISFIDFLLPIGLSFHTFQAMSYTIEVYRGAFKPEKNFLIYSLYVLFYPQLVAGPIERPQNILPQLHNFKPFKYQNLLNGLSLMTWGLFKKVVIADRLGLYVDDVYSSPNNFHFFSICSAIIFYSFQIYCDFSGYSNIAIGAAKVMGYDLMQNFNQPYLATSISEFWRKWHISLSTWFRDYVYISLGGNKFGTFRKALALLTVFLLSGFWHGASWAFILWGGLHGIAIIFSDNIKLKIPKYLSILFTFLLVSIIWIPFRAGAIGPTLSFINNLVSFDFTKAFSNVFNTTEFIFSIALIIFLLVVEYYNSKIIVSKPRYYWASILSLFIFSYLFGVFNKHQFIYFQF